MSRAITGHHREASEPRVLPGDFWSAFLDLAARQPDVEAILAPGRRSLRFGELPSRIESVRRALNAAGIGKGDLVATALPNGADTAVCMIAVACVATAMPLNPAYSEHEFERYLRRIRPKALVLPAADGSAARGVAATLAIPVLDLVTDPTECGTLSLRSNHHATPGQTGWNGAEDVVFILQTSGSTGEARFVPLKPRILFAYAAAARDFFRFDQNDRSIHVMPMFHGNGVKASLLNPLIAGAGVVCPDRFDVPSFFVNLEIFRPTWFSAGFTMQQAIVDGIDAHREQARAAGLRFIRSGSGRLDLRIIAGLEDAFGAPVVEGYSTSETGAIACNPLPPAVRKPGSVGQCGLNEVRIIDANGNVLEGDREGQVIVRGPTVVDGYWDDAEATAEAFAGGWFHTGDLGRFDNDGYLTITGRLKETINRGGEKISPVEIENVLGAHPAVSEVCVFPVPHPTLGQSVAAAFVARPASALDESGLIAFARERLTSFKVPRTVVRLDRLPRNANGKLQRAHMAEQLGLMPSAPPTPRSAIANGRPMTALEVAVASLFASTLRQDRVAPDEDFFLLGGDSLSAITLLSQIQEAFGVNVAFSSLLDEASTVAGMADHIEASRSRAVVASPLRSFDTVAPIGRRDPSAPSPVSFQQRRLWFIDRLFPGNWAYHVHSTIRMTGVLDVAALEEAVNRVVARHEALRTTFVAVEGEPFQIVAPSLVIPLPTRDLRESSPAQRDAEMQRLLEDEVQRPFDLARGPLLRALLVRLADEDHALVIVQHHIVTDVWSRGIVHRELAAVYDALAQRVPSLLPDVALQYPDYAAWQRRNLTGERLDQLLDYWRTRLAGAPPEVRLPTDHQRRAADSFVGSRVDWFPSKGLIDAFFELARKEKTSPYFAWLAAFAVFLGRCSGEDDIVVGVPVQGRGRAETLGVVGFFVNMLPVRTDLSANPTFRELLGRVRKVAASDLAHQDLPFEHLVEHLQPHRRLGETPLFNTTCVLIDGSSRVSRPGWHQHAENFDRGTAPFDLGLALMEVDRGPRVSLQYNRGVFEPATVEGLLSRFGQLLEGVVADPDRPVAEIPLLTPEERHAIVVSWNETKAEYPAEASLSALFEARVDASPNAIAVSDGRRRLTYAQLDQEANRLAHALVAQGIGPGVVVGVCLERSIEVIVATLAIVKAGAAYFPLDTNYPDSRKEFILADANAAVLVTRSTLLSPGAAAPRPVVCLDTVGTDVPPHPVARPSVATTGHDLAYVMYTSGSTGRPKGVAVRQQGVSRLVINTNYLAFSPAIVIAQVSNVAFDAATFEIWGALLNGGRLEILDDDTVLRPERLADAITVRGVSAMFLTTALFNQTSAVRPDAFRALDTLLVGGETADPTAFRQVLDAGPPRHLINIYGPTETTTFAAFHEASEVQTSALSIPIGRPIANTRLHVLGPDMSPAPIGCAGELYVGGPGVALGYVDLPALTSARFLPDPFSNHPGDRLYKTGDRARYRADGTIEHLGRLDRQIKLRGFRIEPAEIEAALTRHPHVAEAAVELDESRPEHRHLVGYVTRRSGASASPPDLRAFLRDALPEFMIPDAFVWLDRLPLTPSGKLDRSALRFDATPVGRPAAVPPRTETERIVAGIWAEQMGLASVGVEDDFFERGGHSLLAVRLVAALEERFGVSLALSLLFEAPTVSALARAIEQRASQRSTTRAIPIEPGGSKPPIFALPGGGGSVIAYGLLARQLGRDQPFYGLEHPGLDGGEVPPDRVESVAASFVPEILRRPPDEPCVLMGACSGAIVAFELARLLAAEGRRVDRVILLGPSSIGSNRSRTALLPVWRRLTVVRFIAKRMSSYARDLRRLEGPARREFLWQKSRTLGRLVRHRNLFLESGREMHRRRVREATVAALLRYSPKPYGGAVALIVGSRVRKGAQTTGVRWQAVCTGRLEVFRLGCATSGEMVRPPILGELVRLLQDLL